jgi:hypothetical protein
MIKVQTDTLYGQMGPAPKNPVRTTFLHSKRKLRITQIELDQALLQEQGVCLNCFLLIDECEPDTTHRHCPNCKRFVVFSLEWLVVADRLEIVEQLHQSDIRGVQSSL